MKLDDNWYELYKSLYSTTFNRLMTIGTVQEGYENFSIKSIDDISNLIDKYYPKNEFYISLYNYTTKEPILSWNQIDINEYEKNAEKSCILFKFRENTDIIQEEISEMNEIQKFMFIRRSINLGSNKCMIEDVKKTYNTIKELFNLESWTMFNGYNECYLYIFLNNNLKLKNPSLTFYYFYKFIEKIANVKTLSYTQVNPFSQIVTLPGSQNNNTRLYAKPYNIHSEYIEIIDNSTNKTLEYFDLKKNQNTSKLESLLKTVDKEINNRESDETSDAWNYDLDEIFNEIID